MGWLAHEVFCPQKWSLDGKFENHWSGSLRVSLDAFPLLGLSLQALYFLAGSWGSRGWGSSRPGGPGPGSKCPRPHCHKYFRRLCLLRGSGQICWLGKGEAEEGPFRECSGFVCLCLALHSFIFSSPSGVPGKKCGTIILSAEELSNCRVSGRGNQDRVWWGWGWSRGRGQTALPVTPGPHVSLEGSEEVRSPQFYLAVQEFCNI